jgi:hypothetical protein
MTHGITGDMTGEVTSDMVAGTTGGMAVDASVEAPVPSPCINICRMDLDRKYCQGCARTLLEIGRWEQMTRKDVEQAFPDESAAWEKDPYTFAPAGGFPVATRGVCRDPGQECRYCGGRAKSVLTPRCGNRSVPSRAALARASTAARRGIA